MPPYIVRIDDRLIHGQVVEGWIVPLRMEEVIVVSDAAASDETQKTMMGLSLPPQVELEVLTAAKAAAHPVFTMAYSRRAMVVAPGPGEILELLRLGAIFTRLNVGGIHASAGRVQLGRAVFLSEEDRRLLREIEKFGVAITAKALPDDAEIDLIAALGGAP